MNKLINKLPWWMNPKYPMGRTDYWWACLKITCIILIGYLATCFCIGVIGAVIGGPEFSIDTLPAAWTGLAMLPWILLYVPLQYRRCKAAAITYQIIWIDLGLIVADIFAYPDRNASPLTLVTTVIGLWIWLAPNKMDVVRKNPQAEQLTPSASQT